MISLKVFNELFGEVLANRENIEKKIKNVSTEDYEALLEDKDFMPLLLKHFPSIFFVAKKGEKGKTEKEVTDFIVRVLTNYKRLFDREIDSEAFLEKQTEIIFSYRDA